MGEKRRSNGTERDDKASKKPRPVTVKKETIKEEKSPLPAAPVPELITIDNDLDSDSNFLEYTGQVGHVLKIFMYSY